MIGGSLYIVGGRDGDAMGALNTAERYDEDLQEWVEDEDAKLAIPRTRHSANFVSVDWCQNLDMEEDDDESDRQEEDGRSFVFSKSSSGEIKWANGCFTVLYLQAVFSLVRTSDTY